MKWHIPIRALLILAFLLYGPISNTTGDFAVLGSKLDDFKIFSGADKKELHEPCM